MRIVLDGIGSKELDRELDVIVYGDAGVPVVALPTRDASAGSWEYDGLVDALSERVEAGELQLVCVDSADDRSWVAYSAPLEYRAEEARAYLAFLTKELPGVVKELTGSAARPVLAGVGVGATSALGALLVRPAAFGGALLVSGAYDARLFSNGEESGAWLACSPVDMLGELKPRAQASIAKQQIAFACTGEAAEAQQQAEERFAACGLAATFEYWDGADGLGAWRDMVAELLPAVTEKDGLASRAAEREAERVRRAKARVAEAENIAAERAEDERAARERLAAEQAGIEERAEAHREATEAAQAAWQEHSEAAATLARLEQKARQLQAQADVTAQALADARWFAGEAQGAFDAARAAREEADALVAKARADL